MRNLNQHVNYLTFRQNIRNHVFRILNYPGASQPLESILCYLLLRAAICCNLLPFVCICLYFQRFVDFGRFVTICCYFLQVVAICYYGAICYDVLLSVAKC